MECTHLTKPNVTFQLRKQGCKAFNGHSFSTLFEDFFVSPGRILSIFKNTLRVSVDQNGSPTRILCMFKNTLCIPVDLNGNC